MIRIEAHKRYMVGEVEYPSVTQVLNVVSKPYLVSWANRLGRKGINSEVMIGRAAAIGTLAHAMVHAYLTNDTVDAEGYMATHVEAAGNALRSFVLWYDSHHVVPLALEMPLVSESLGYGGTLDAVMAVDGVNTLIDFKTSKSIHKEYFAQLWAYKQLWESEASEAGDGFFVRRPSIERCMVLQLGTQGAPNYTISYMKDEEYYGGYFTRALELYKVVKDIDQYEIVFTHVE